MNNVLLGPAIISPVVTRFFCPPLMPRIIWLPTCEHARIKQLKTGCRQMEETLTTAAAADASVSSSRGALSRRMNGLLVLW